MRLEVGRVNHDGLVLGALSGQADHDPGEDPVVTPTLPTVVEGLGRSVFLRRIAPPQPIAIDKDYAANDTEVINARLAMALGEFGGSGNSPGDCFPDKRLQARHLRLGKPVKIAHRSVSLQSLNHAKNLKSMGLEPRKKEERRSRHRSLSWRIEHQDRAP